MEKRNKVIWTTVAQMEGQWSNVWPLNNSVLPVSLSGELIQYAASNDPDHRKPTWSSTIQKGDVVSVEGQHAVLLSEIQPSEGSA